MFPFYTTAFVASYIGPVLHRRFLGSPPVPMSFPMLNTPSISQDTACVLLSPSDAGLSLLLPTPVRLERHQVGVVRMVVRALLSPYRPIREKHGTPDVFSTQLVI